MLLIMKTVWSLVLKQLKNMIESKEPYDKIMRIIHKVIQTNIQDIFKLPLNTSK